MSLTTCQFTYLPGVLQNVGNNSLDSDVSRTTGASSPFSVADGNITGGVEQEGPDAGIYQSGYCAALMFLLRSHGLGIVRNTHCHALPASRLLCLLTCDCLLC